MSSIYRYIPTIGGPLNDHIDTIYSTTTYRPYTDRIASIYRHTDQIPATYRLDDQSTSRYRPVKLGHRCHQIGQQRYDRVSSRPTLEFEFLRLQHGRSRGFHRRILGFPLAPVPRPPYDLPLGLRGCHLRRSSGKSNKCWPEPLAMCSPWRCRVRLWREGSWAQTLHCVRSSRGQTGILQGCEDGIHRCSRRFTTQ